MQARQERTARAALSSLVCTLVTATAHAAGGGPLPHPLVLGLAFVFGIALCFGLGGRRVTLGHLMLAIGATQGVLHAAFTFGGGGATGAGAIMPVSGSAGHMPADAARLVMDPALMPAGHSGGGMLLAHVIAGLLTVCSLRAGTAALRRIVRAVALRVGGALARVAVAAAALAEPVDVPRDCRPVPDARPRRLVALLEARIQGRRGPPRAAFAA